MILVNDNALLWTDPLYSFCCREGRAKNMTLTQFLKHWKAKIALVNVEQLRMADHVILFQSEAHRNLFLLRYGDQI